MLELTARKGSNKLSSFIQFAKVSILETIPGKLHQWIYLRDGAHISIIILIKSYNNHQTSYNNHQKSSDSYKNIQKSSNIHWKKSKKTHKHISISHSFPSSSHPKGPRPRLARGAKGVSSPASPAALASLRKAARSPAASWTCHDWQYITINIGIINWGIHN